MSAITWLQTAKGWQLKHACFLTGLAMTGTKSELATTLSLALSKIHTPTTQRGRIVSVDMGIKNLAMCVLDAPHLSQQKQAGAAARSKKPLKIVAWKKTDVLSQLVTTPLPSQVETEAPPTVPGKEGATAAANFAPSIMANVAFTLTDGWLQTYAPDQLLIERQRFRSGGASAVQEWTLRVNMLESMLWACLRTLRSGFEEKQKQTFPALAEVNPARVAAFWCSSEVAATRQVIPDLLADGTDTEVIFKQLEKKKKIEKKHKIDVVRSWLTDTRAEAEIALEFTSETREIADAFLRETKRGARKKTDPLPPAIAGLGKLDDLADCLLQAVAWVKWEENRLAIRRLLDEALRKQT